jgi:hypothetical protein
VDSCKRQYREKNVRRELVQMQPNAWMVRTNKGASLTPLDEVNEYMNI